MDVRSDRMLRRRAFIGRLGSCMLRGTQFRGPGAHGIENVDQSSLSEAFLIGFFDWAFHPEALFVENWVVSLLSGLALLKIRSFLSSRSIFDWTSGTDVPLRSIFDWIQRRGRFWLCNAPVQLAQATAKRPAQPSAEAATAGRPARAWPRAASRDPRAEKTNSAQSGAARALWS